MNPDESKSYDLIKASLLKAYAKTSDSYFMKFDNAIIENGESMKQFLDRIRGYYLRWIEIAKIEKTFEGLFNEAIKSKIYKLVNSELGTYLRERA
jgi:hypothetical protein